MPDADGSPDRSNGLGIGVDQEGYPGLAIPLMIERVAGERCNLSQGTGSTNGDKADPARNIAGLILASFALAVFFFSVLLLWGKADDANNETAWARWTFLLAGIEAVAFAGAGWIFGREVNRAAVAQSQKQANEAQAEAKAQRERAVEAVTSGRRLRDSIIAKAGIASGGRPQDALDGGPVDAASPDLQELVALAQRAFPG
jgi:hypothetical protein